VTINAPLHPHLRNFAFGAGAICSGNNAGREVSVQG
jgi:hypothetical protein